MVLAAGNFLNAGGYGGDAAGFKLSSLLKLSDTRANKPDFTLLHFVAQMAKKKNPMLLSLPEITACKEAVQYSVESLNGDVAAIRGKIKAVKDQLPFCKDDAFNAGIAAFLQKADDELTSTDAKMSKLEELRFELAEFFCEDIKTFRLDDCTKTFHEFFGKLHKATQENELQAIAEEKAKRRTYERSQSNQILCSADGRNSIRRSTSCVAPSRSLVESIRYHDSTTTSVDIEDPTAKRPTSSGTERSFSTERRVRRVGMNAMDSSNDLLDFLADEDSSVGSGEFVRTGSLRGRRRPRLPVDAVNDSRERTTSPLMTPVSEGDLPPPSLSRGGPGRWSLRERVRPRATPSPPVCASALLAAKLAATQPSGDTSSLPPPTVNAIRSVSDELSVSDREYLLNRPENSLERRRKARLQQCASPITTVSDVNDRQPKLSGRLPQWPPTVTDVAESNGGLRREQMQVPADTNLRRWSTCEVDRAIHEVEQIGRESESGVAASSAIAKPKPEENAHQRVSASEQAAAPEQLRSGCVDNETKRWGRIFDSDFDDDEPPPGLLQRSATLPRRWRYYVSSRQSPNVDDRMQEIPEHQSLPQAPEDSRRPLRPDTAEPASSDVTVSDDAQIRVLTRRTLPEIPSKSRLASAETSSAPTCALQETAEANVTAASRPTSEEFDDVSTSSSSRDEGFESAVDTGGPSARSSAWSFNDGQASTAGPGSDRLTMRSEATTPCDGDDSVSAGTRFFARSNDSLVNQELVLSGDTIDVDHFDDQQNNAAETAQTQTVPGATTSEPGSEAKVPTSNPKANNVSKSSLLANLTARLSRPRKSSVPQTGSSTGKQAPPPSTPAPARTTGSVSWQGPATKSSTFVRGTALRATMPASLRTTRKPAQNEDPAAPGPSPRTTSIRDSAKNPTASRQTSAGAPLRKPYAEVSSTKPDKPPKPPSQQAARGRVSEPPKTKSNGPEVRGARDKLVLYKVVEKKTKSPATTSTNNNSIKKQTANNATKRSSRLLSFNTPQQSRTLWS